MSISSIIQIALLRAIIPIWTFKHLYLYSRLGLYTSGIITHPEGLVPSSRHFTVSAAPGQGGCGRAQSSLFRPVAFSPVWGRIECGMGNLLGDQALTLHTRNGGRSLCPPSGRPLLGSQMHSESLGQCPLEPVSSVFSQWVTWVEG